jgi:hypothetical protein
MKRSSVGAIGFLFGIFAALAPLSQGESLNSDGLVSGAVELSRKEVHLGTHKVTYIRIRPPTLPQPPPALVATPAVEPTAEQILTEKRRAEKKYESLPISCTVFVGTTSISELTWNLEGRVFRAYSNVDFRHLTQLSEIETETTIYSWFPFVYECSLSAIPIPDRPQGIALFDNISAVPECEYFFEGTQSDALINDSTLKALDYLHAYYQLNRNSLAEAFKKREAENTAREQYLKANPPQKKDTIMQFWKM